jgi:hypothetical protein
MKVERMASKEVIQLIRQIRRWPGWRVEEVSKGFMVYPPDKTRAPIAIHKTPSDYRHLKNTLALLRAAGAPI